MNVIGVRFKKAGKIYYYDANDIDFEYKDMAVINTDNGLEIAEVALTNIDINADRFEEDLSLVLRKATSEDLNTHLSNKNDAKDAIDICQDLADDNNLSMKIVDCDYNFDRSKITFYFTSEKRVDFRNLVKDLAQTFKSRIELRQIGVRDHAKLISHHGSCGQECCCSRHLTDFAPLSIKYAKDQNISLDPTKISGVCGRLMCCLSYEQDAYLVAKKTMPKYGQKVQTEDGEGIVVANDYVREQCKVKVFCEESEESIEKVYKMCDLKNCNS